MNTPQRLVTLLVLVLGLAVPAAACAQGTPPPELANREHYEIVLIHGLGSRAAVWDEVAPFLKGTFDVWTFELSGHGSTPPVANASVDGETARLAAFLEEKGIEYPTVVGHGVGGMIALRYTLDNPARVHRVIVMDSAPRQLATKEQQAEMLADLAAGYGPAVAERFLNLSPNEDVTDQVVDTALRTDSASYITLLTSTMDFDVTPELGSLSVPLLVVGSELMFPVQEDAQAILHGTGFGFARTLSFKRVAGAGHFMMLDRPILTASVLLAFGVTAKHVFEH